MHSFFIITEKCDVILDHQGYCLVSGPSTAASNSPKAVNILTHLNNSLLQQQRNRSTTRPLSQTTMPVLTRECLALKLRQNWLAKHPQDTATAPGTPLDDSLTSLNWLQNLNIMKITTPTPPSSPTPDGGDSGLSPMLPQYTPQTQVNPNAVLNMGNVVIKEEPMSSPGSPAAGLYKLQNPLMMEVAPPLMTNQNAALHEKIDYKTNPYVKPPYSYATLICMAMKETKKNKITLAGIYNWITDNFMYYRHADPSWQVILK